MNFDKLSTITKTMSAKYNRFYTSSEAISSILEHTKLKDFSKILAIHFLTYKSNADNMFIVYPSHTFLMKKFNASKTTISNAIRDLKDNNIIMVAYDSDGRYFKRKNFYIIVPLLTYIDTERYIKIISQFVTFDTDELIKSISSYKSYVSSGVVCDDDIGDIDDE